MPAVLTGTPTAVTWASGADPAGQSITIPGDATAAYMFWAYLDAGSDGTGLASATLASAAPDQTFEVPDAADFEPGTGVVAWYNPPTGSQTLDVAWDADPGAGGPVCIVAYVKDGDLSSWRDADGANEDESAAVSVTLTTAAGDLVLKFDQRDDAGGTPPGTSASWTSAQTHGNNNEGSRLSYISAAGATQVCDSENESYSSIVAISIPEFSGGASVGQSRLIGGKLVGGLLVR